MTTEKKDKTLYEALLSVQQEAPFIDKSAANPFFKSKYADMPAIWGAIKDILGKNNVVVTHSMSCADGVDYINTKIIHAPSGEFIESTSRILLGRSTAQEYGSYITYMRRYALTAMLGLVTDEDDDGNKATAAKQSEPKKQPPEKELANKIGQQLKDAQTLDVLKYVYEGFEKNGSLSKVKAASETAHKALVDLYANRTSDLSQAPIETDNIQY